jgi:2-polyprenyl-6-methoxyphenol hydroxylase-like FAD-dependent oxidoreductase
VIVGGGFGGLFAAKALRRADVDVTLVDRTKLWLAVHLMTLTGFKNRLSVLFNWTVAFLGRGRTQRDITAQQVFARHPLEGHARDAARESATSPAVKTPGANPIRNPVA